MKVFVLLYTLLEITRYSVVGLYTSLEVAPTDYLSKITRSPITAQETFFAPQRKLCAIVTLIFEYDYDLASLPCFLRLQKYTLLTYLFTYNDTSQSG